MSRASFGKTSGGDDVDLFVLSRGGIEARIITLGGALISLEVPDREGRPADVVLGYRDLAGYEADRDNLGLLVGRYGNRIAKGRFILDGVPVQLTINDGANHLHGGSNGFGRVLWTAEPFTAENATGVVLTHRSPDGHEGYPGTLNAKVAYTLHDRGELTLDYEATTDRPTPVNLTHHAYFNLAGEAHGDVLGHELTIPAGRFTAVGPGLIPTGELAPVEGTPFDFRRPTRIGARIEDDHPQLHLANGYDHNFVLDGDPGALRPAARLSEASSGRVMDIHTTEPGLQLYTGNFLDGSIVGKTGTAYGRRSALCLETQHFPDSPNHPSFPDTILRPGAIYRTRTTFTFSTRPR